MRFVIEGVCFCVFWLTVFALLQTSAKSEFMHVPSNNREFTRNSHFVRVPPVRSPEVKFQESVPEQHVDHVFLPILAKYGPMPRTPARTDAALQVDIIPLARMPRRGLVDRQSVDADIVPQLF